MRVSVEDVDDDDGVEGEGLRLPQPSFNRSRLSKPGDVVVDVESAYNGIAKVKVGDLPKMVEVKDPKTGKIETFEVYVAWDPVPKTETEQANPAHTEIRVRPAGSPKQAHVPGSETKRQQI